MSHRSSGELFAVGCSQAVSSWAHSRFGLVDVEDLAVALSGSLGQKRKKKNKKSELQLLATSLLILLGSSLNPRWTNSKDLRGSVGNLFWPPKEYRASFPVIPRLSVWWQWWLWFCPPRSFMLLALSWTLLCPGMCELGVWVENLTWFVIGRVG